MLFYFPLGILTFFWGAQVCLRSFAINWLKVSKYFLWLAIILIFIFLIFQTYQQYQAWLKSDISKHLLPPYTGINYFIFYILSRFFAPYLISLAAAILFILSAKMMNKKYNERFFYPEEYYLGATAIFLIGYPGWLFYLVFLILFYLLIHILSFLMPYILHLKPHISPQRISLYHLWLPIAIFVIIINNLYFSSLSLWSVLEI